MYYVARVNATKCSEFNCKQCTDYCPETNTLMFDHEKKVAWVDESRCKGCEICVFVCTDLLSRGCITMEMAQVKEG